MFQFNTQNNTAHGFPLSIFEQNKNVNFSLAEDGKCCNQPWWVTTVSMWIRRSFLNQNASSLQFLTNGFWKHWVEGTHTNKFERWPFYYLNFFLPYLNFFTCGKLYVVMHRNNTNTTSCTSKSTKTHEEWRRGHTTHSFFITHWHHHFFT